MTAAANARRRTGSSEPWQTILPASAHLELVARTGWQPGDAVDAAQLDSDAPAGRSLLVAAAPGMIVLPPAGGGPA